MKYVKLEKCLNRPCDSSIIVCKSAIKNGKKGMKIDIKNSFSKPKLIDEFESSDFKQRSIGYLNEEEMRKLSETNPKLCFEKLILSQFENSYITSESKGDNYILPNRFKSLYNECISFSSEDYKVYFTDLSSKYFSEFIDRLKLRRENDVLEYATGMINSGKVSNLRLSLFDGFNFKRSNECYFGDKESGFHYREPKNTLYYRIDLDENGKFNKRDLENMKKLIELFIEKNKGLSYIEWDDTDLVACTHNQGVFLDSRLSIESYDKYPELFKHVFSLNRK